MRKSMFAVGLLSAVLASGCALGSNAPGRAAGAVKDGARRETSGNVAEEKFIEQLYGSTSANALITSGQGTQPPAG